jgi:chemotaxis methyl-accepting protein methylase
LNVTETEGLRIFNALRRTLIEKHMKSFSLNRNVKNDNKVIWNAISEYLELDAIIHNLYIKECYQRRKRVDSNVPNTTVLCVKETHFIRRESICEIVKEEVQNEH